MGEIVSLVVGSLAGGFARYFFGGAIQRMTSSDFPYGTLFVNLSGCFLIGLFHSLAVSRLALGAQARMLLMVGFCGAFSTFSTWMLDTSLMIDQGKSLAALANIAASIILGLVLFRLGISLGEIRWMARAGLGNPPLAAVDESSR